MVDTKKFIKFTREMYGSDFIPLHRPVFEGNEIKYLIDCVESNFVSSVGKKVTEFEESIAKFTGSKFAVATVNGTAALHIALLLAKVKENDEVITQALTFVATCNAISYTGARPVFVDVDVDTMGMSPIALKNFLINNAERKNGEVFNKHTGRRIAGCLPMHTFGFPARIKEIANICSEWNINLIEDAAESLGSFADKKHTGRFGQSATLSFNGNKVITTGGGGMIITDDQELASLAKHITTTAKSPHPYEFFHDNIGYNYRMPNINAALGCAQMEYLDKLLIIKQEVSRKWSDFFISENTKFVEPIHGNKSNYWLNAIVLNSKNERDEFIQYTNDNNVMTRPIWTLMSKIPMFKDCQSDDLENSLWLEERVVNIPSSVPDGTLKQS
jgi:aminotransferase in exopolysaccharide biosynthesis